jgi:predicted RNase H-like nuclease
VSAIAAGATLGIDGCRGGWCWFRIDAGGIDHGVTARLAEMLPLLCRTQLALIDIPIGLKDAGAQERRCDREARTLLGRPRASSVFRAPCRDTLTAPDYRSACEINRSKTGVQISKQTWNILPRIREADALIRQHPHLQHILREAHPELAFWGLNRAAPMTHNKKAEAGIKERLALLARFHAPAVREAEHALGAHPSRLRAPDDVADALCLAVSAAICLRDGICKVPREAEIDGEGLAMEMSFALA